MKIFDEDEINKASLQYSTLIHSTDELDSIEAEAFAAGVKYAESKVEDLCIEFVEWINSKMDWNFENEYKTYKELFQQFLTQRNGK